MYQGADKSLARPGRKQATATKLLTFASHSKTGSSISTVSPVGSSVGALYQKLYIQSKSAPEDGRICRPKRRAELKWLRNEKVVASRWLLRSQHRVHVTLKEQHEMAAHVDRQLVTPFVEERFLHVFCQLKSCCWISFYVGQYTCTWTPITCARAEGKKLANPHRTEITVYFLFSVIIQNTEKKKVAPRAVNNVFR